MSNQDIITASCIILQQEDAFRNTIFSTLKYFSLTDYFLLQNMRRSSEEMARVGHYYEITIPSYTLDEFKTHFRLSRDTFERTCQRLSTVNAYNNLKGPTPNLEKELLMFLWYIGNLESFRSMADRFGTSKGSFHSSITRVSSSLTSIMAEVIRWLTSQAELNETSQTFGENCQFQNVLGALDGSHIPINAPKHQPQAYFNRKKFYSVVLLACCNANMEFTYVWTGNPGSTHDATVLRMSDLFQNSDGKIPVGFVILGDSAFPLLQWLITPFRDCGNLTEQQRKFNREHSHSRQVIERSFGLLKCRFRRLLRFEFSNMKILVESILAACVLHNLCISDTDFIEVPDEFEACHDMPYARDGHQLQGIQTRQQMMNQLI